MMARRVFRLSDSEAALLYDIMQRIGGNPDRSPRGIADGLSQRLRKTFGNGRIAPRASGAISYDDYTSR